jgi:hypothetical protein
MMAILTAVLLQALYGTLSSRNETDNQEDGMQLDADNQEDRFPCDDESMLTDGQSIRNDVSDNETSGDDRRRSEWSLRTKKQVAIHSRMALPVYYLMTVTMIRLEFGMLKLS